MSNEDPGATAHAIGSIRLKVPTTLQQVPKLMRYQIRQYLQSRRFLALVVIIVAIGAIFSGVVFHFRPGFIFNSFAFYASAWGGGVPYIIILTAVFFGGDAIAGEFQNKTGYFLMSMPIRRATVYAGKYLAALVASLALIALYFVIILANGIYYFGAGAFPWQLGVSLILSIVYLSAVLGTTFLFSSLFKTSAYGFVLVAILFLIGFSLFQTLIYDLAGIEPWMVISYASSVISNVLNPVPSSINWGLYSTKTYTPFLGTTLIPGVAEGVVIMLGYFILTTVAGLLLFEKEEFT
ncbi:MAG: ABC transporter permease [Candidatus Thermoplasmatota archaeon]|jgi:ABC-2 type transport system permease protein|nr:ABC transporter permease [Candidatus Thermoplasmatota archaeon]MCL5800338.1 ABC transporter permease [Candidatus Thermoplasmatota archaeon]